MPLTVYIYFPRPSEKGQEFLDSVSSSIPGSLIEVISDRAGLSAWIYRPKDPSSVMIFWNPTHTELRQIGAMKDLLLGVRTVLVLPDGEAETVALAQQIRPVSITYVDDGTSTIVSVLKRLSEIGGTSVER